MSILNKFFDKILCINRLEDVDRYNSCIKQFKSYNIDVIFLPPIDTQYIKEYVEVGKEDHSLILAHRQCIQFAKLNNWNKIAILEDDILFYDDLENEFINFISELPTKWDLLYLGQAEWVEGIWDTKKEPYNSKVSICKYGCGTHFMGINSSVYDIMIDLLKYPHEPIDLLYQCILRNNKYCCYTPINKSFANAISLPHEKYHKLIKDFDNTKFVPSLLRKTSKTP